MIYLYTLPGVAFNIPNISVSLIKGYLGNNGISNKQIDLSISFLDKCVNSFYIRNVLKNYYINLSSEEKKIVDGIDKTIDCLKKNNIDTDAIIKSNVNFLEYLNIYSRYYDIVWDRSGLCFNFQIKKIDDVLKFAYDTHNSIFDCIFDIPKPLENDIYYISIQYPFQFPYAIRFAKIIKKNNANANIILGGDYITHIVKNANELMKKCIYIDAIVFFGEQKNLLELIKYFNKMRKENVANTCIRKENNIIMNEFEKCTLIDKKMYIPCFEDLDFKKYISNVKLIPLTLNYGCYHSKCKFCSRYFYYNGYVKFDLEVIFNFIKEQYEKNSIQAIYFVDECVPAEILIKLGRYLVENDIKIKWMVETRIDSKLQNKDVAELLYNSGCRQISFGIESYNKKILKDMDKGIDLKVAKKIMKNFFQAGISTSATFMIGYPTENIFNIIRTLSFIKNFKYLDTFGLRIFNYMRNSILVNLGNLDETSDLNLIYRKVDDNYDFYNSILEKFTRLERIKIFLEFRRKVLYRSQYLYLDRKKYSLNYRIGGSMEFKNILKKKSNIEELIFIKELKPEMTQCRVVQVDKKIKEKGNEKV